MKACVIGAGFAGLAAADALVEAGVEVTVFEARYRVGGRVWSQRLQNGAIIERGAEYVELEQEALISTVARLGLRLAPAGVSFNNREPRGGLPTTRERVQNAVEKVRQMLADHPERLFRDTVAQVLADAPIEQAEREAIASRIQVTAARPPQDLCAYTLVQVGFSSVEGLRIAGGNQGVALKFAERLGSRIRLGQLVTSVSWSDARVTVRTPSDVLEADACVVAVPATVISRIRFDPPLPDWKTNAFKNIKYGYAAKLYLPLRTVPPPSAVLSVPEHYWSYTAKGPDGQVQPVVTAFSGSREALEALDVKNGPGKWIKSLQRLRPDLEMNTDEAVLSTWANDPWVGAAYSALTPGNTPKNDIQVRRHVGGLYFAGEHTSAPAAGVMDSALRSGYRVANEILGLVL